MTATQPRSGRPCNMTAGSAHAAQESIANDLQTSCGLQISTTTVHRELHGMGFHGRAAASKPYITKCNAERQMQWCKACRHWTLEQWRCSLENSTCLTALCQV
ncbi:unnamed protein product [Staurois parvus]|uniref:Transposase Tc1-like domain-containing protein n=1 Tax=Staurois parvus TaxID=386267 RepID=A0ABN9CJ13_9NEOB|nr:unnamed protein product [Staurois parvus]